MKLTTTQAKLRATTTTLSQEKDSNANKSNEIKQLQSKLDLLTIEKNKLLNALNEEKANENQKIAYKSSAPKSSIPLSSLENDFNVVVADDDDDDHHHLHHFHTEQQQDAAVTLAQQNNHDHVDDDDLDDDEQDDDRKVVGVNDDDESYVDMDDMSKLSMTAIYAGHDNEAGFQSGSNDDDYNE